MAMIVLTLLVQHCDLTVIFNVSRIRRNQCIHMRHHNMIEEAPKLAISTHCRNMGLHIHEKAQTTTMNGRTLDSVLTVERAVSKSVSKSASQSIS